MNPTSSSAAATAVATVAVTGAFDDIRSRHLRLLQEASRLGEVVVLLWDDEAIAAKTGKPARFPLAERRYFLEAVRFVSRVVPVATPLGEGALPFRPDDCPGCWVDEDGPLTAARKEFSARHGMRYHPLSVESLGGFPEIPPAPGSRKKVVVTGCYDWFHSGHVRFFEEVSRHGDLYVIVGHDANIRLLKGPGHPLLPQAERRYVAASIRHVTQALISTGEGWLDADPEIRRLKPDIYAVNEDGDKGGKRDYCAQNGIEYLVLERTPAPGLPRRSSTDLRGF